MFCAECGQQIADGSRFCSHCGKAQGNLAGTAARPEATPLNADDRMSGGRIIGIALAAIVGIAAIGSLAGGPDNASSPALTESLADNMSVAEPGASPTLASPWSYSTDEDKLRGSKTYYAAATSTNQIQQASPYSGGTTMTVTIRNGKGDGTNIMLAISEGQMMCPSYRGCDALVRFDRKPVERVRLIGPSDNSSETVFVVNERPFLAKLRKAKHMTIEKTIYQAGSPQWEFDVAGLKWDH